MTHRSTFGLLASVILVLAACGDDTSTGAGGAAAGSGGSDGGASPTGAGSAGGPATSSGETTASTATSATSSSTATGSSGGSGGSAPGACEEVLIGDGEATSCETAAPRGAKALDDAVECPTTIDRGWPATIFEVDVAAGDCLQMRADNAGSPGTDLFGALVDPGGDSLLFDDEVPCTVASEEYACPEGAISITTTGRAFVIVGSFEGEGCAPQTATPVQLVVGRNGEDVDLERAFVCVGDLLEIIP